MPDIGQGSVHMLDKLLALHQAENPPYFGKASKRSHAASTQKNWE